MGSGILAATQGSRTLNHVLKIETISPKNGKPQNLELSALSSAAGLGVCKFAGLRASGALEL